MLFKTKVESSTSASAAVHRFPPSRSTKRCHAVSFAQHLCSGLPRANDWAPLLYPAQLWPPIAPHLRGGFWTCGPGTWNEKPPASRNAGGPKSRRASPFHRRRPNRGSSGQPQSPALGRTRRFTCRVPGPTRITEPQDASHRGVRLSQHRLGIPSNTCSSTIVLRLGTRLPRRMA